MRTFALLSALALLAAPTFAGIIGGDDFDGGLTYASRVISPDLSATNGAFPSSIYDVFGVTDRSVNYDIADDTAGSYAADTYGILETAKTDKVFGIEDLTNPDNAAGTGTATWTFDISGYTGLAISLDIAAMGDFELADSFAFAYSIDGGASQSLLQTVTREDLDDYAYTLESGTVVNVSDPLEINGIVLNNKFQTFTLPLTGAGTTLTLEFSALNDGSKELFIFDNLTVTGVPEPTSLLLIGLAGLLVRRR